MDKGESIDKPGKERNGRRKKAACSEDQSHEKYILGHMSRITQELNCVQAEVLMPYLRILSGTPSHDCFASVEILRVPARAKRNRRNSCARP